MVRVVACFPGSSAGARHQQRHEGHADNLWRSRGCAARKRCGGRGVCAGPGLPGQARDEHVQHCSTTARTVPRTMCAANYLDGSGSYTNASSTGPFVIASAADAFNDKLAFVATAAFMPLLERRIALETRNALLEYRRTSPCRCYPWADWNADGASDSGTSRGRIPVKNALPHNWPAGVLPSYFASNDWARVIHYVVGRNALEDTGRACATCSDATLSIDGTNGTDALLLTPDSPPAPRRARR